MAKKKKLPPHANPDRWQRILKMEAQGMTQAAIGKAEGISTSRVQQIISWERHKKELKKRLRLNRLNPFLKR